MSQIFDPGKMFVVKHDRKIRGFFPSCGAAPKSLFLFPFLLFLLPGCESPAVDRTCNPQDAWSCRQTGFFCGETPFGGRCVPWSCGDGVQDAPEECDGVDAVSCASYIGGTGSFACDASCRWDFSGCSRCGNRVLNGLEDCDGDRFADGFSCEALGYSGGQVECLPTCRVSTLHCLP
jgi:hypothetical protein